MAYTIEAGYEKMIEGFGGKGYVPGLARRGVRTPGRMLQSEMCQDVVQGAF